MPRQRSHQVKYKPVVMPPVLMMQELLAISQRVWPFRLEEVRRRLQDASQDQVPILTMALEAGFGSVVAFNRAFKESYGLTPSAYRARRNDPRVTASP